MKTDIYRKIKERILFLEYAPGEHLNEKSMTEEFGVSRTPLREVLNRLEWEQLIRIVPRSGTIVTEIEFQKMMNVYRIRLEIEKLVGALAAENVTDNQLEKISSLADECKMLLGIKNPKKLAIISFKFREILHDATNNPVLSQISEYLFNLTHRVWQTVFATGEWAEEVNMLADEIEQTNKVLAARDSGKAAKIREEFLRKFLNRIKDKF